MNAPQSTKATLKKAERIKSLKTIDELFKNSSSFFLSPYKVLYRFSETEKTKVAFMVSKRNFKTAVDRNRVKRLMREAWRLNKQKLIIKDTPLKVRIIWIYTAQTLPKQSDIGNAMLKCLQKIIKERNT